MTSYISVTLVYIYCFRLIYVRNGDFVSGGPIENPVPIMYIPLNEELAVEINRRIGNDDVYELVGLSLNYDIEPTSPSETSTTMPIPSTNATSSSSSTEEPFLTSAPGFAATAGAVVACLALITCSIIACVCLRIKQRARDQKTKRFVLHHQQFNIQNV